MKASVPCRSPSGTVPLGAMGASFIAESSVAGDAGSVRSSAPSETGSVPDVRFLSPQNKGLQADNLRIETRWQTPTACAPALRQKAVASRTCALKSKNQ